MASLGGPMYAGSFLFILPVTIASPVSAYNHYMPEKATEDIQSLLQSYFPRAFPGRADPQVAGLERLSGGWESDVYAFNVEWGQPALRQREDLVLRIYPGEDAFEKSANEFRNLSLLRQAGYPVPRVDCLEREASPFGQPFIIMERIHGHPMWGPMFHAAPKKRQKLQQQFCRLFARLHAIDWRPLVPDPAAFEPAGPYDLVERQFARWQPYIDALPLPGFKAGWDWLLEHQRQVTSSGASLVHWDFHPNNILIKDDGSPEQGADGEAYGGACVIDWTGLELTDYRFDLGWTLLLLTTYEGDRWREPLLREYERQAGHTVEGMAFFDAVASYRRLVSMVGSLAFGAEKLGMRPGAEEIMRGQAKHLSRVYAKFQAITGLRMPEVEPFLTDTGFLSRIKRIGRMTRIRFFFKK